MFRYLKTVTFVAVLMQRFYGCVRLSIFATNTETAPNHSTLSQLLY